MQCPGCGFQNMPGVRQCAVCSALLTAEASPQDVTPPRAQHRTPGQRLRYMFDSSDRLPQVGDRLAAAASSARDGWRSVARASHPQLPFTISFRGQLGWLNLHAVRLMLLSVVPGFAHWFVLGRPRVGRAIFLASVAALILAVLLYRTPLSNLLVYGVVLTSAVSVFCVAARLATTAARREAVPRLQFGVGLMVMALYLGLNYMATIALSPAVQVVRVIHAVPAGVVSGGDTVVLWKVGRISRGDTVVAWVEYGQAVQNIAIVYGTPGDLVTISDRLYINGRPIEADLPRLMQEEDGHSYAYSAAVSVERRLGGDQYWVVPNLNQAPDVRTLLDTGTIRRERIVGRVAAIINPPAHRGLISRAPTVER